MSTNFTQIVISDDEDGQLSTFLTANDRAKHDAALLNVSAAQLSMKVSLSSGQAPVFDFHLVGNNGLYPPNWPASARISQESLNPIVPAFELVQKAASEGTVRPRYLQDVIWAPQTDNGSVSHIAYMLPSDLLPSLLLSLQYTCGAKPCLMHNRRTFLSTIVLMVAIAVQVSNVPQRGSWTTARNALDVQSPTGSFP